MATIINTPGSGSNENGAAGWIVAVVAIVLLILGGLYLFNGSNDSTIETETPAATGQGEPPVVNNNYSTTINASTTINNSTTTEE